MRERRTRADAPGAGGRGSRAGLRRRRRSRACGARRRRRRAPASARSGPAPGESRADGARSGGGAPLARGRGGGGPHRRVIRAPWGRLLPDSTHESGQRRWIPGLGPLDLAQHLDLRLEQDPEALVDAAAALGHQGEDVGGGRAAGVLDEVGVLLGEAGAADLEPATARGLQQLARGPPPARASSAGFLKVEPKVLIPDGCASRRLPRISASVPLISATSPSPSRKEARETTSPGPRFERR